MVFGLQTWCPSLYCCFAFYCSHRRRAGSPETVVKESSTICLEKNTEENFNHGCRDCSGPRIVTYLLAAASWQSRSECPSGKRRNRTPCSCACYLPQGYLWGAYTAFLCLLEREEGLPPNHVHSVAWGELAVRQGHQQNTDVQKHTAGQF